MKLKTCQLCEATSAGTAVHFTRRNVICDWCDSDLAQRGLRYCRTCAATFPATQAIASEPHRCPACRTAKRRVKYLANADREKAAARVKRQANAAVETARRRERYQTDPEYRARKQAYHRAYYWRHRDKWRELRKARDPVRMNELRRRWRAAHREQDAERKRMQRIRQKLAILRGAR